MSNTYNFNLLGLNENQTETIATQSIVATDKSNNILLREYDKLAFGDYFHVKWTNNNFLFCDADGLSSYNEHAIMWENQVFILSTKLMDKPVVLIGGAKYKTNNNCAGLGKGLGAASANHYGYDTKSYAIHCYHLPPSNNISKLFLVQKNGKIIYTTSDENILWKTIEDIYNIKDETVFRITLTRIGWNIESIITNCSIKIKTQYVNCSNLTQITQQSTIPVSSINYTSTSGDSFTDRVNLINAFITKNNSTGLSFQKQESETDIFTDAPHTCIKINKT